MRRKSIDSAARMRRIYNPEEGREYMRTLSCRDACSAKSLPHIVFQVRMSRICNVGELESGGFAMNASARLSRIPPSCRSRNTLRARRHASVSQSWEGRNLPAELGAGVQYCCREGHRVVVILLTLGLPLITPRLHRLRALHLARLAWIPTVPSSDCHQAAHYFLLLLRLLRLSCPYA